MGLTYIPFHRIYIQSGLAVWYRSFAKPISRHVFNVGRRWWKWCEINKGKHWEVESQMWNWYVNASAIRWTVLVKIIISIYYLCHCNMNSHCIQWHFLFRILFLLISGTTPACNTPMGHTILILAVYLTFTQNVSTSLLIIYRSINYDNPHLGFVRSCLNTSERETARAPIRFITGEYCKIWCMY